MNNLLPRSLAARVVAASVAAVAVCLACGGIAVVLIAGHADRTALDKDIRRVVDRRAAPALLAVRGTARAAVAPDADRFVRVIGPDGVTDASGGAPVPDGFPRDAGAGAQPVTLSAGGQEWRAVERKIAKGRTLQVAARLQPLHDRAARLTRIVLAVAVVALILAALVARTLTRLALAPLGRLRAAARDVGEAADPARRVPADAEVAEVDELAADLNDMLERLQIAGAERDAALEAARRFAADAGHELRTPLTSLGVNLAALGSVAGSDEDAAAALRSSQAELARLGGLVEQLQALARGSSGPPQRVEPLDLVEIADAAVTAARRRHPEVAFALDAPAQTVPLAGDGEGLRAVLDNLVENAARHGGPRVVVTVAPGVLTVDDDGPGVPAEERAAILTRFGRGSGARGAGSGLGLAIVAAQAERHGGGLTLSESPLGGLRATVALPA
jgi:two-component system, OmpR family, sensor histidine kinase PrrB